MTPFLTVGEEAATHSGRPDADELFADQSVPSGRIAVPVESIRASTRFRLARQNSIGMPARF